MFVIADVVVPQNVLEAVESILRGVGHIVRSVGAVVFIAPVLPLLCWAAFWLFAVDWTRMRQIMLKGGWLGVVLIGAVMVIVWQQISPTTQAVLGLTELSGYVEKLVYVTALVSVMFVCGAVQLTGCCSRCTPATVTEIDSGEGHSG